MASRTQSKSNKSVVAQAADILRRRLLAVAFSAEDLNSRATPNQEEIFRGMQQYLIRYVVAGNQSGKTSLAARELVWVVERNHPYFQPDVVAGDNWGDGPRMVIVAGQDRTIIDSVLWQVKIKPLLSDPDQWKEVRSGSALQSVVHRTRGDQIIFLTHNNSSEQDLKHMQAYSAHYVWIDEMPRSVRVLDELQQRIAAKRGRFICTFTMKVRNDEIRKLVDKSDSMVNEHGAQIGKKYRLGRFDNPIYAGREAEERSKIAGFSEEMQKAILYGDWITSDTQVYRWDPDLMSGKPHGYNPSWRHVLSVDPATESKLGMTVWAECPQTNIWWCVQADYIQGIYVPSLIVAEVERRVAGLNVTHRIYDSAEPWFAHQAYHSSRVVYSPIREKSGNKQNFIAKLQESLGTTVKIADWCTLLIDEIASCERVDEGSDKIVNASRYHLLDSAHYFVMMKPLRAEVLTYSCRADYLIQQDNHRIEKEHKAKKQSLAKYMKKKYTTNTWGKGRKWV